MIVLLWIGAGTLALAGTRLCVPAFLAVASASVVVSGGGNASAWAAATAGLLIALGRPPRSTALPAFGVAAVLAAAHAPNASLLLPAWTVASACVGASAASRQDRRWSATVLATDAFVVAAVIAFVAAHGFGRWPDELRMPYAVLLAVAALARAPLAAGPTDRTAAAGLVLVRAQVAILVTIVCSSPAGRATTSGVAVAGAVLFAAGPFARRDALRDATQEGGVLTVAIAAAALGWAGRGWPVAIFGLGTAVHVSRLADPRGTAARRAARAIAASGGLGAPLAAAGAALAWRAVVQPGTSPRAVALLLVAGLAGRVAGGAQARRTTSSPLAGAVAAATVGAGALATVVALAPTGTWARLGTGVLLIAGACGGAVWAAPLTPARPPRPRGAWNIRAEPIIRVAGAPLALAERTWALGIAVGGFALIALVLWALAFSRGFL